METVAKPATRIAELDALRGIAAIAVVLFHYTTRYEAQYGHVTPLPFGAPQGDSGILLFFGISGFVIVMTLDRTRSLADFAASRASRLFPAYWTAIGLTTAVVAVAGMADLAQPPHVVLLNFTMIHGFANVPSVDGVYWTLGVELCFYVVMAAIWRAGLLPRIEPVLIGWLLLRWLWTYVPAMPDLVGAVLVQQYIPFFAIGIAAYRMRSGARRWPYTVVAAALVTTALCDGPGYFLVALIAAAALLFVALRGAAILRWAPLVWLGTISYSLYLLHQNIGYVIIRMLEAAGLSSTVAVLVTIAVALLLATVVTYAIERPALGWLRARYKRINARRPAGHPSPTAATPV